MRGLPRFGLCSTPWFECKIYNDSILNLGQIVELRAKADNVKNGLSSDIINMGSFVLTRVEKTNIPHVYNIRGELNIAANDKISDAVKNLMVNDVLYLIKAPYDLPTYVMGLYPLIKEVYGDSFYNQSEATVSQSPVDTNIEALIAENIEYESGSPYRGNWYISYDVYCQDGWEPSDPTAKIIRYTDSNCSYSFTSTRGDDYARARQIMYDLYKSIGSSELLTLLKLDPFINWTEPNAYRKYDFIKNPIPVENGKIIYLGPNVMERGSRYYVAVPKKLIFRDSVVGKVFNFEVAKQVNALKHTCSDLSNCRGITVDRNLHEITDSYDEIKFTYDFLDNINLREKLNDALEVHGFCSKIKREVVNSGSVLDSKFIIFKLPEIREYSEGLFPDYNLYPTNSLYPEKTLNANKESVFGYNTCQSLNYGNKLNEYNSVLYSFLDVNGNERTASMSNNAVNGQQYVLKDNNFFKMAKEYYPGWHEYYIRNGILKELHKLKFWDVSVDTFGNPLIQPWDRIEVIDPNDKQNKIESFVISRTISGDQFMRDSIECKTELNETIEAHYVPIEDPDEEIPNDGPELAPPGGY